ncbi:hypothetical protein YC2023_115999 [Brassica napus]
MDENQVSVCFLLFSSRILLSFVFVEVFLGFRLGIRDFPIKWGRIVTTVTQCGKAHLGSETSGLAMLLVRACGAETFVPWTLLERAGVQRHTVLATLRIIYPYEEMRGLNFHSGSSIYSSQWFACLASHTSRSDSPEVTGVTVKLLKDHSHPNIVECFFFKIIHVPRVRNQFSNFLAKTVKTFRTELLFISCSIPVWLTRPPQA